MAFSAYRPLAKEGAEFDSPPSSNSARLTPDPDSEDTDPEHQVDLDELEAYELQTWVKRADPGHVAQHTDSVGQDMSEDDEEGEDEDDDDDDNYGSEDDVDTGRVTLRKYKRRRRASVQSFELYTPDEERRVRRKLDTRLVLFVAMLYLLAFLDRSNIGNCKVAGLTNDLHLSDEQFEALLTAFYISYILFEWMTLCYKIFPPHIYISCCVCAWGVLASLQSLASGFGYLLALRALLGIGEAAFVGIPFYLSFFFRRDELALRTGLFISAAPLATTFASSLAWAITRFGEGTGIAAWRLLFLLEGFPACLVAMWAWYWIPDSPSTALWLTSRERKVAKLRMRQEQISKKHDTTMPMDVNSPRHKQKFQWREVTKTLMDPVCYLTAIMFFCCNVAFSSMPVFLPTIIHEMGFSTLQSQALSAPPFLFAFVIVLLTAFISDRIKSRSIPMMAHAFVAMLGYVFLAVAGSFQASFLLRYISVFPICAGFFSAVTIIITWTVNNQDSDEGKGTGMAILNVVGQLGPLVGTRLYPDKDGPYFVKGMSVCAVAMAVVGILAFILRFVLMRKNQRMRREALLPGEDYKADFLFMT
nr:putative transporter [Quercus suber]